jgi:glycosyltransferase involved in cell wall biosynthesis
MVSIIIPCFNRSSMLGKTLDSIIIQSYAVWECIVVDDGSSDYTLELMDFYQEKDSRIKFLKRPNTYRKGANACRNYGFENSKGEYIQWFDSDDLMLPNFLEAKLRALENTAKDYVISRTINFKDPYPSNIVNLNEAYYKFNDFKITHYNYVVQNINWLTCDFMARRKLVKDIKFNEKLQSAQERNFFSKITAYSTNALVIEDYLTLRRVHDNSTQSILRDDLDAVKKSYFQYCYQTYFELKDIQRGAASTFLFNELLEYSMARKVPLYYIFNIFLALVWINFKASFWYLIYQLSYKFFNKGHVFRERFRKVWHPDIKNPNLLSKLSHIAKSENGVCINILTRTSGRPNAFKQCFNSIKNQTYNNIRHIVSYDDPKDLAYIDNYEVEKLNLVSEFSYKRSNQEIKPYNLYCNELMQKVKDGWILYLDDDNVLSHSKVVETIVSQLQFHDSDTLFIWQTEFPDNSRIPNHYIFKRRIIEKCQIDTACFLFHSKYKNKVKWDNKRMADYRFIKELAEIIPNQTWIQMVMTRKLNFGDSGNRNDIDC